VDRAQNEFRNGVRYRRTTGRHEFRLGFDLMRRQLNGRDSDNHNDFGTWAFRNNFGLDAIEALRHGLATTHWQSFGLIHRGFRTWDLAGYAGDRWQVTPRFTIDYGLRWRASTAPTEVNGLTNLPYRSDWNNLGPTLGLAFRLPDRWGVFRAGAALQYGEIFPASYQQSRFNQPHNIKNIVNDPDLLNPLGSIIGTAPRRPVRLRPRTRLSLTSASTPLSGNSPPRVVGPSAPLTSAPGAKLLTHWYFNRARWAAGEIPNTGMINEVRPNPEFLDMRRLVNGSMSWYDAGRITVTSARWRGMNLELSYWLSKSRDLGGDYTNTAYDVDSFRNASQTEENVHGDLRALSRFDQPHAFLARVNAELPAIPPRPARRPPALGGWTASSVILLKSGTPFTVSTGSDAPGFGNVDGIGGDRPNVVDPSILGRTIGNPDTSRARLPCPPSPTCARRPERQPRALHLPPRRHLQRQCRPAAPVDSEGRRPPPVPRRFRELPQYAPIRRTRRQHDRPQLRRHHQHSQRRPQLPLQHRLPLVAPPEATPAPALSSIEECWLPSTPSPAARRG
jgi:hypothetical protein